MSTTFLLIRHASTDATDKRITGRARGIHLNEHGMREAINLGEWLACSPLDAIYSSPLERALETARPASEKLKLRIEASDALLELECGEWTGRTFEELSNDERWRRFNVFRSSTRIPGGELMLDVQARMVTELERLRMRHPRSIVALFSHGDVIRSTLAYYAGIPLDLMLRLEISPACVSALQLREDGATIQFVNFRPGLTLAKR